MYNKDVVFQDIIQYINMKPLDKMNFIAYNNERIVDMLDYFVDITKDRK